MELMVVPTLTNELSSITAADSSLIGLPSFITSSVTVVVTIFLSFIAGPEGADIVSDVLISAITTKGL